MWQKPKCPFTDLWDDPEAQALVNWNQQHWTVLRREVLTGHWVHLNSQPGTLIHQGRRDLNQVGILTFLANIQQMCGGVTLHQVTRVRSEGTALLLSTEGMRAMLPPEVEETIADDQVSEDRRACAPTDCATFATEIKLATLNALML